MMCFVGLLDLEQHLGRHFQQHFVVYLNQSQDTPASATGEGETFRERKKKRASCATCGMTVTISYLKARMESSHGICVPQTRGVDEVWRGPTMYVVSLPKVLQEAISPVPGCPAVAYSVGRLFEHFMFCHFRSKVAVVQ